MEDKQYANEREQHDFAVLNRVLPSAADISKYDSIIERCLESKSTRLQELLLVSWDRLASRGIPGYFSFCVNALITEHSNVERGFVCRAFSNRDVTWNCSADELTELSGRFLTLNASEAICFRYFVASITSERVLTAEEVNAATTACRSSQSVVAGVFCLVILCRSQVVDQESLFWISEIDDSLFSCTLACCQFLRDRGKEFIRKTKARVLRAAINDKSNVDLYWWLFTLAFNPDPNALTSAEWVRCIDRLPLENKEIAFRAISSASSPSVDILETTVAHLKYEETRHSARNALRQILGQCDELGSCITISVSCLRDLLEEAS